MIAPAGALTEQALTYGCSRFFWIEMASLTLIMGM